jgi:hypothetical protein
VRSAPAADPPLRISNIETIGGQVTLTWPGGPGMRLQQATNLSTPAWQDFPATTGADSATLPTTNAAAFFRLLAP